MQKSVHNSSSGRGRIGPARTRASKAFTERVDARIIVSSPEREGTGRMKTEVHHRSPRTWGVGGGGRKGIYRGAGSRELR